MSADLPKFREIVAEAEKLSSKGKLTRAKFQEFYRDAKKALGDGVEAEGIEALVNLAPRSNWIPRGE